MRILMTTDTIGGVWTFTQELATGLLEAGCDIALVSLGYLPNQVQQQWADHMRERWFEHFQFDSEDAPLEWMQENDSAFTQAGPALLRTAEDFGPDVLHCNQFCFGALPIDLPKVITAHSDVLSWAKSCRVAELDDSIWLRHYRSLVQRGLDGAQNVVAPTRSMLDALGENFRLPGGCRVIGNGRYIRPMPHKSRKLQAITAGRLWDEAKNIKLLSKVSSPIPLLVAGDSLFDGVSVSSTSGAVRMLGSLAENDLLRYFGDSELYICTSCYEPFGLAPLEAAMCGCALLLNDIPSLREVWQDAPLYFHDAVSLSELLCRLHGDRKLLTEARERSSVQASLYSREKMSCAYLSLFRHVRVRDKEIPYVA